MTTLDDARATFRAPEYDAPDPVETEIVHVRHYFWYLWNATDYITEPLRQGKTVVFHAGMTWGESATMGMAPHISADLLAAGVDHTHTVVGEKNMWCIVFKPLRSLS